MERIYEFLSENADFGYRVYIANDKSRYMSFEDAIQYLEGKEIEVDYLDQNFKPQHGKYTDWTAQIIQHELDHVDGVVI